MLKNKFSKFKETAIGVDPNMTRIEKFEVFCRVCDGLLNDGRIKSTASSWTNIEDYDKQEHSRCHKFTKRLGGF